jgi:hypothetical protein
MSREILHCDWSHEADDVRRCPTVGDAGVWVCYEHYLELASTQDVPAWVTLPRQYDDDPDVTLAKRAAELLTDLRALYYKDRDVDDFSILNARLELVSSGEPSIHVTRDDLEAISDPREWVWATQTYHDGKRGFAAEVVMWGIVFNAYIGMFDDDPRATAESLGCPEEVLDEYANS